MPDHETNEAIARWMGDKRIPLRAKCPDGMVFSLDSEIDDPQRFIEDLDATIEYGPDYSTDPAAALRVLARMNDDLIGESYELFVVEGEASVFHYFGSNDIYTLHEMWVDDTPSAAIVAAWRAEFWGGK